MAPDLVRMTQIHQNATKLDARVTSSQKQGDMMSKGVIGLLEMNASIECSECRITKER
jgi:hypothetical protein